MTETGFKVEVPMGPVPREPDQFARYMAVSALLLSGYVAHLCLT